MDMSATMIFTDGSSSSSSSKDRLLHFTRKFRSFPTPFPVFDAQIPFNLASQTLNFPEPSFTVHRHLPAVAVEEVFNKALSEPIGPHFAIASIGPSFDLHQAHQLITTKLGSKVPVVTNVPSEIIGRDAIPMNSKRFTLLST